jgi:hypothetical protein
MPALPGNDKCCDFAATPLSPRLVCVREDANYHHAPAQQRKDYCNNNQNSISCHIRLRGSWVKRSRRLRVLRVGWIVLTGGRWDRVRSVVGRRIMSCVWRSHYRMRRHNRAYSGARPCIHWCIRPTLSYILLRMGYAVSRLRNRFWARGGFKCSRELDGGRVALIRSTRKRAKDHGFDSRRNV